MSLLPLLRAARAARADWLASQPDTTAYRLFHGAVEGRPGLAVDRYGDVLLAQTFRAPLEPSDRTALDAFAADLAGVDHVVWNHRGRPKIEPEPLSAEAQQARTVREEGMAFSFAARHRGLDPWLFLDFRVGRRAVRAAAQDKSVLNLFAYTGTMGVAAAAGGARAAVNVDFAASSLEVAADNAVKNDVDDRVENWKEDVIPTLRQLAGLPVKGRGARRRYTRRSARAFDVVVLDPPTFAKSPFGAIDPVRDYASLFKPAVLATTPGGVVLATNHVSTVERDPWLASLRRCAEKAGRPLLDVEVLQPDPDFPSPDGNPPLKLAWCRVS